MTSDQRQELIRAIDDGKVVNASAFAQAFASKHGLNASTVRSTISRLRRERGLIKAKDLVAARDRDTKSFIRILDATPDDKWAVEIVATSVVKYEGDEVFRRAVDREKRRPQDFYKSLRELQAIFGPGVKHRRPR